MQSKSQLLNSRSSLLGKEIGMGNKLFNRDMKTQIAVIYFCIYFGITLLPTTLSMAAFNLTPRSLAIYKLGALW